MASKKPTLKLNPPIGELRWVFITGEGKEAMNGDSMRYSAAAYFKEDDPKLTEFREKIEAFWKENKPKGARKAKSIGIYYEVKVPDDEAPDGFKLTQHSVTQPLDDEMEKTGLVIVSAWTGTTMPDGKAKVVKVKNAKGRTVEMGDRKIGNGSRGVLGTTAGIYDNSGNQGVTLYLNALQLVKFVEYQEDDSFDEIDEEDAWTGEDEDGFEPQEETSGANKVEL